MYESFYKLSEKPFRIVPNPGVLYLSQKHQAALTYLEYGVMEDIGVILLTGEIGMGKTTLVRYILNTLCKDTPSSVIFNTNVTPNELLSLILKGFDIDCREEAKTERIEALYRYLIDRFSEKKKPLLIIDEAQNLSAEALEEVRMLSNLQSDDEILLQIVLVGQPNLKAKLLAPGLAQFAQRIGVNYHLSAFTREETAAYLQYRLEKAGRTDPLFTAEAIDLLHEASGGIPRSINLISDFSLVYAFGEGEDPVGAGAIRKVVEENFGTEIGKNPDCASDNRGNADNIDFEKRLLYLEEALKKLQLQTEWYVRKLEDKASNFTDSLVSKLNNQLTTERRRNDLMRSRYNSLVKKYNALRVKTVN